MNRELLSMIECKNWDLNKFTCVYCNQCDKCLYPFYATFYNNEDNKIKKNKAALIIEI